MEIGNLRDAFNCHRNLALEPRAATRALLALRRDSGFHRRWTLGAHGSFELQGDIVDIESSRHQRHGVHLAGRLWDPAGTTMTGVDIELHPIEADVVEISMHPAQSLPSWFRNDDLEHWSDLAHVALDELCEELLWHASQDPERGHAVAR